jgi:hypothetical protein
MNRLSGDLVQYMCDLIKSNFVSFIEIDGDTTSNEVLASHTEFVVSLLICGMAFVIYKVETRPWTINALKTLIETSNNNEIRRAAAYTLGYVCVKNTYKILFNLLQTEVNRQTNETANDSDYFLSSLISSYCHCVSECESDFDEDDMDLFRKLLKHSYESVLSTARVGLARVLKNKSLLLEMLDTDYIQCYHALMGSTAYVFVQNIRQNNENAAAEYIEQHPDLLSIFVIELYNRIRHFTVSVQHVQTKDFYSAYSHPAYVTVAALIAVRMPATFCAYIKDWHDGDSLKRALFCTSKQHERLQRAACLTILSIFGDLTIELCEMFIEALRDDPHMQNNCYKCLTRINAIKDEKAVLNLLFSYLKSKSMNARYAATKMLLHLSQSSLISSDQVRALLNKLMSDSSSNEDLWLIKEQEGVLVECEYHYAGPMKDVIYSLLVQHLTGDASGGVKRNELNDINSNFVQSRQASRLASCIYEEKTEENTEINIPSTTKMID